MSAIFTYFPMQSYMRSYKIEVPSKIQIFNPEVQGSLGAKLHAARNLFIYLVCLVVNNQHAFNYLKHSF